MTKRERVLAAIHHKETDKVPKGELYIQPQIANKLLGKDYPLDHQHFERDRAVRELLRMDVINVGDWPEWQIGETEDGKKIVKSVYGQTFIVGDESKALLEPPLDIEDAEKRVQWLSQYPCDVKEVFLRMSGMYEALEEN